MRRLVNRIKYYFKVYFYLSRFSLLDILIYRPNAFLIGLAPIVWLATMIVFLVTVYSRVQQLAGWTFWEVVFLTGVHELIFLSTWATFIGNLRRFIDDVRTGRFDQDLLKPLKSRFLVSFKSLDLTGLGSFLNVFFVFFFSYAKIIDKIQPLRLIGFLFLLFLCYFICYFLYFILASLALFFINARTLIDWIFDMTDFDRYPAGIYPPSLQAFLTFFLPILFFAYVPTAFLLGKLGAEYLFYGPAILIILSLASHFIWRWGLKNYQSASS